MSRYEFNGQAFELRYPAVMGILNLTPDSFSDGGDFFDTEAAIEHALSMVEAGAQIIDLGEKALVRAVTPYPRGRARPGSSGPRKTSYRPIRPFHRHDQTNRCPGSLASRSPRHQRRIGRKPRTTRLGPEPPGRLCSHACSRLSEEHAGPAGV